MAVGEGYYCYIQKNNCYSVLTTMSSSHFVSEFNIKLCVCVLEREKTTCLARGSVSHKAMHGSGTKGQDSGE